MKKVFKLQNLDCAVCAQKMEDGIKKIDGVNSCSVNFFTQKLVLDAVDDMFDDVLFKATKACKKIEPDCEISD